MRFGPKPSARFAAEEAQMQRHRGRADGRIDEGPASLCEREVGKTIDRCQMRGAVRIRIVGAGIHFQHHTAGIVAGALQVEKVAGKVVSGRSVVR